MWRWSKSHFVVFLYSWKSLSRERERERGKGIVTGLPFAICFQLPGELVVLLKADDELNVITNNMWSIKIEMNYDFFVRELEWFFFASVPQMALQLFYLRAIYSPWVFSNQRHLLLHLFFSPNSICTRISFNILVRDLMLIDESKWLKELFRLKFHSPVDWIYKYQKIWNC